MSQPRKRPNHRPQEMKDGKRRNVYIDDESWALAQKLGAGEGSDSKGNGSRGIRFALQIASELVLVSDTARGRAVVT